MIEVTGNLWAYPATARVITTNGTVRKDGAAVMGRGCAKEAADMFPGLQRELGRMITKYGNKVLILPADYQLLFSYPVKDNWHEKAKLSLIERSAKELMLMKYLHLDKDDIIVLPRPGCGNGQLNWDDVRKVIAPILNDNFHVITWE